MNDRRLVLVGVLTPLYAIVATDESTTYQYRYPNWTRAGILARTFAILNETEDLS